MMTVSAMTLYNKEIEEEFPIDEMRIFLKMNLHYLDYGVVYDDNKKPCWIFYRKFNKVIWNKI